MSKIVAVRHNDDGDLKEFMLDSGEIMSYEQAVDAIHAGTIEGCNVGKTKTGGRSFMFKNMKKIITTTMLVAMTATSIPTAAYAAEIAVPNTSTVMVNGESVDVTAYTISGYNYFKLRDMAAIMKDTAASFGVTFNHSEKCVAINTQEEYVPTGNELKVSESKENKSAIVSNQRLTLDYDEITMQAYLIDGNNYFKLRDLGKRLGFEVSWDNTTKTVSINTHEDVVNEEEPVVQSKPSNNKDLGTFTMKEDDFILIREMVPNAVKGFSYTCFYPGGVNIHVDGSDTDGAEAREVTSRPVTVRRFGYLVGSSVGTCVVDVYSYPTKSLHANGYNKKYSTYTTDGMTYVGTATINVVPK